MQLAGGTLARYFGLRFVSATLGIFVGILALSTLIDYVELMRRASDVTDASPAVMAKIAFFRMPQLGERLMPFCVLIGTMSSYLNFSRRNELVVARAAGVSAWQFVTPAALCAFLLGLLAVGAYNPISATLQEQAKRLEADVFGNEQSKIAVNNGSFWIAQRTAGGKAYINAGSSRAQGLDLSAVTVFKFDKSGAYVERIEAQSAVLQDRFWHMTKVRSYPIGQRPQDQPTLDLPTNLTREQVSENFATPESVPFWELPHYIKTAEHAGLTGAGYRLQFNKLLAKPFLLGAIVFLASAVSLRFFRFGGIQKMILGGILAGFLLYVLSKIADDMTTAGLMSPVAAAWAGVLAAAAVGVTALLYQEDG
ncbi:MAG TPA: LPS export ABC transporter permease LptG [Pseudolabrys sp.]|jgi:lipopolysaccharide export system permease protein|nr:LPS export ABC transporter permease LptG [Pseudolabrys sp.]